MTTQTFSSIYNLCIKSDGVFVSEKQSKFFASKFPNNEIIELQSFSFGEFNGCTRTISWITEFDATGIVSVTKSTAKTNEQFFVRGQINKFLETKITKATNKVARDTVELQRQLDSAKQSIITHQAGLDSLVAERCVLVKALIEAKVDDSIVESVVANYNVKIVIFQQNIDDSSKFIFENSSNI